VLACFLDMEIIKEFSSLNRIQLPKVNTIYFN
jgi:hypothetical protein